MASELRQILFQLASVRADLQALCPQANHDPDLEAAQRVKAFLKDLPKHTDLKAVSSCLRAMLTTEPVDEALITRLSNLAADLLAKLPPGQQGNREGWPGGLWELHRLRHDLLNYSLALLALPDARQILETLAQDAQVKGDEALRPLIQTAQTALQQTPPGDGPVTCALSAVEQAIAHLEPLLGDAAPTDGLRRVRGIQGLVIVEDNPTWQAWLTSIVEEITAEFNLPQGIRHLTCRRELEEWLKDQRSLPKKKRGRILALVDLSLPREPRRDCGRISPDDVPTYEPTLALLKSPEPTQSRTDIPTIVISGHSEMIAAVAGLGVANRDFVFKDTCAPQGPERTRQALRTRLREYLEPVPMEACELKLLDFSGQDVFFNGVHVRLTKRRFEALRLLADDEVRRQGFGQDLAAMAILRGWFADLAPSGDEFVQYFPTALDRALTEGVKQIREACRKAGMPMPRGQLHRVEKGCYRLRCQTSLCSSPHELGLKAEPFRILIVEDEQADREFLLALCTSAYGSRVEVKAVSCENELRVALAEKVYPAVLLDLEIPSDTATGPQAGVEAFRYLVQDREVRHVIVYSKYATEAVSARLQQLSQATPGSSWDQLLRLRPPAFVAKEGNRLEEGSRILSLLVAAERDCLSKTISADIPPIGKEKALPEVVLPAESDRFARPRKGCMPDWRFIVNGRVVRPQVQGRETLQEPWRAYNLLHRLALAPGFSFSTHDLTDHFIKTGLLRTPDARTEVSTVWVTRSLSCLRYGKGMEALGTELAQALISEADGSYCLNARVRFAGAEEWQKLTSEAQNGTREETAAPDDPSGN